MMKKIWSKVFLISAILVVVGAVCIGVSYFLGGSLDELYQNKTVLPVLEMFTIENIVNSISAFFGI